MQQIDREAPAADKGDAAQQRSWQALGVAATLDAGRVSLVRPVLERVLGIG